MNYVVAVDGSTESERALEHALKLASAIGASASITVVHSVDPEVHGEDGIPADADVTDADRLLVQEGVGDAEERAMEVLEDAATFAAEHGHEVETELLYGDPSESIPEFLAAEEFDGLFVGHRGLGERYEELLGSTAKGLVETTRIPVTIVSTP
jgi:nucleotide-binding universal stress UspA family protein